MNITRGQILAKMTRNTRKLRDFSNRLRATESPDTNVATIRYSPFCAYPWDINICIRKGYILTIGYKRGAILSADSLDSSAIDENVDAQSRLSYKPSDGCCLVVLPKVDVGLDELTKASWLLAFKQSVLTGTFRIFVTRFYCPGQCGEALILVNYLWKCKKKKNCVYLKKQSGQASQWVLRISRKRLSIHILSLFSGLNKRSATPMQLLARSRSLIFLLLCKNTLLYMIKRKLHGRLNIWILFSRGKRQHFTTRK